MAEPGVQLFPGVAQQLVLHALVLRQHRGQAGPRRRRLLVLRRLLHLLAAARRHVVLAAVVVALVEDDVLEAGSGQRGQVNHDHKGHNGTRHCGSHCKAVAFSFVFRGVARSLTAVQLDWIFTWVRQGAKEVVAAMPVSRAE